MKKKLMAFISLYFALVFQANAAIITLTPTTVSVFLNDTFTVDVEVDGLLTGEELALFDLDMLFNSSLLQLNSIGFGTALNDGDFFGSIQELFLNGPTNATETSTLFEFELQALQSGSFNILTLGFTAIGLTPGTDISVGINPLGFGFLDYDGNDLTISQINPATVTVLQAPVPAPEPAMLLLFATGLLITRLRIN